MRNGQGICAYSDGGFYQGEWHKGQRQGNSNILSNIYLQGEGVMLHENGEDFGYFENDKIEGEGYRTVDGSTKRALFQNGEFVEYLD